MNKGLEDGRWSVDHLLGPSGQLSLLPLVSGYWFTSVGATPWSVCLPLRRVRKVGVD